MVRFTVFYWFSLGISCHTFGEMEKEWSGYNTWSSDDDTFILITWFNIYQIIASISQSSLRTS
jgi:hypothetical protein